MLSRMIAKTAETPREKLFWMLIVTLAVAQLIGFWMLCSHQVRKAQVRDATLQVEKMAVADCLEYMPRATLDSCTTRPGAQERQPDAAQVPGQGLPDAAAGQRSMSSTVPVSFTR